MTERRFAARRLLACVALMAASLCAAAADERVVEQLEIVQPRTFGYHIGDRFAREITLTLRAPYALNLKALPPAGRFSEFLALAAPRVDVEQRGAATVYGIRFDYQVVNVGTEAASIAVPHHELVYGDGKESLKALVPATRVTVTPLRGADDASLQPDAAPAPQVFAPRMLLVWVGVFVLSLLGLVFIHGRLPSWRPARPFTLAHDEVRAAQRRGWGDEDYAAALRAVHRAFNATAGRTVFADALDEFLAAHSSFRSQEAALEEFFARSRRHFFGASESETPRYTASELLLLVRRCRDAERGLA